MVFLLLNKNDSTCQDIFFLLFDWIHNSIKLIGANFSTILLILLHEFSHKYKNPKLGLDISNETGADVNALYVYLGLGFSKIDAICVFANVFLVAQTKGNIERMRKIMDYIQKFESGQFAKPNLVPEYV